MGKPSANRPSFFKVMIGDFTKKLRIPPQFKRHLANLRRNSVLRSSRCGFWPVEVRRKNGDWFFKNGWEKFVTDHSIVHGDFLIFFHDGGYKFKVNIYGKSGCEKNAGKKEKGKRISSEKIATYPPENRPTGRKSPLIAGVGKRSSLLGKRIGKPIIDRQPNAVKREKGNAIPTEEFAVSPPENRPNKRKAPWIVGEGKRSHLYKKQRDRRMVLIASCGFIATNPYFAAVMGKSYNSHVSIPQELSRELDLSGKELMILQNPYGSSWFVDIALRGSGRVKLGAGWSAFHKGNCLTEGDVCFFEFVEEGVVHVHIFRVHEIGKPGLEEDNTQLDRKSGGPIRSDAKEVTCNDRDRVLELANSFETNHSKYVARWKRTRLYDLPIPRSLVIEHNLKMKTKIILHDPNGRSWTIKVCQWKGGAVGLGRGWQQFSQGNHLMEGDACVLEFIQADQILAHIIRYSSN